MSAALGSVAQPQAERTRMLLSAPVLGTLLRLAAPNVADAAARVTFIAFDAVFVSWLGADALAGISVAFPIFLLMQLMSAGGLGAGVSAAVARAMGAGTRSDADAVAWHAFVIALIAGGAFTVLLVALGPRLYSAIGLRGAALDAALAYSNLVFGGIVFVWLMNTLANVVRGTGQMMVPAASIVAGEGVHLALSPALILGWGPFPALGVAGAAIGVLAAYFVGSAILLLYLLSGRGEVRISSRSLELHRRHFAAILGVGVLAALNAAQVQLTVILISVFVAKYGTVTLAGYGAASRLDLLLIPLSFALGAAIIPVAATNAAAGDWARVRAVARIGTALMSGLGLIFGVIAIALPHSWMHVFTGDTAVIEPGVLYLSVLSVTYPLLGLAMGLAYTMLGLGRPAWPFLAGTLRLAIVGIGGWLAAIVLTATFFQLLLVVATGTVALSVVMLFAGRKLLFDSK